MKKKTWLSFLLDFSIIVFGEIKEVIRDGLKERKRKQWDKEEK